MSNSYSSLSLMHNTPALTNIQVDPRAKLIRNSRLRAIANILALLTYCTLGAWIFCLCFHVGLLFNNWNGFERVKDESMRNLAFMSLAAVLFMSLHILAHEVGESAVNQIKSLGELNRQGEVLADPDKEQCYNRRFRLGAGALVFSLNQISIIAPQNLGPVPSVWICLSTAAAIFCYLPLVSRLHNEINSG